MSVGGRAGSSTGRSGVASRGTSWPGWRTRVRACLRRDVLDPAQQTALAEAAYYRNPIDVDEANALLAAYRIGHTPAYQEMRPTLTGEQALKDAGLIHCDNGPHHAQPHDDVRYSLDYHHDSY